MNFFFCVWVLSVCGFLGSSNSLVGNAEAIKDTTDSIVDVVISTGEEAQVETIDIKDLLNTDTDPQNEAVSTSQHKEGQPLENDLEDNKSNEESKDGSVLEGVIEEDKQGTKFVHPGKPEALVLNCDENENSVSCVNKKAKDFDTVLKTLFPEVSTPDHQVAGDESSDKVKEIGQSNVVVEQQETNDITDIDGKPKQKVVPLLYTFRTLFTSFLAEFTVDNALDGSTNSSKIADGNSTVAEIMENTNSTGNGTDSGKKTRFQCAPKNISENATGTVKIVNSTELLEMLNFSKSQKSSICVLVLFYAPWCPFCAQTAPHYNALARVFPQLDILAVDTSHFSYLNARFGTVAVPNIMLFHSRSAVRFNHSSRVLESFVDFVTNNTGLDPNGTFVLEPSDQLGPLPSTVVPTRDWLLWLAWGFVLSCSGYGFVKSRLGQGFLDRVNVLWQEHQHIE